MSCMKTACTINSFQRIYFLTTSYHCFSPMSIKNINMENLGSVSTHSEEQSTVCPSLPKATTTPKRITRSSISRELSPELEAAEEMLITPTKLLPKAIRDLQDQLSRDLPPPGSKRRRGVARTSVLDEEIEPIKKKKVVTSITPQLSNGLVSPPVTPSKIIKPAFSLTDLLIRSETTNKEPAAKKLDFGSGKTAALVPTILSPPVTPVKSKDDVTSVNCMEARPSDVSKFSISQNENKENKENIPPNKLQRSVFTRAKAVFQRSFNHQVEAHLPEREGEAQALKDFFLQNIVNQTSTSLYISGPPGTGKTAQVMQTLSQMIDTSSNRPVQTCEINGTDFRIGYTYINCMTVSKTTSIYQEIFQTLTHNKRVPLRESKEELISTLSDNNHADMNIIILDELDKLITVDQQILFEIFSWVIYKEARMILVGISNALDMVDRLLPRLKMNGLNPNTLPFLPYDATQIANIIKSRLMLLNEDKKSTRIPLFHPAAIQLTAKRSSSNTGDLRKAFDICRQAIEMCEKETRGGNIFNQPAFTLENAPLVKINHVLKVCNAVFNQNQSSKLKNLNFLQKHIICLLIQAENQAKKSKSSVLTLNSFFEFYLKNGKVDSLINVLKKGEFLEVLTTLESIGVVRLNKALTKACAESKISSSLARSDLVDAIKGITILEQLIPAEEILN